MIHPQKVGKRIQMLRKEKKLSQEQLAEGVHVTPQAVSKWETGRSLPETATLPLLANVLGQSVDSILLPQELAIHSAIYTDGKDSADVTGFVQSFISGSRIFLHVNSYVFPQLAESRRMKVLLVKYEIPAGCYFACVPKEGTLALDSDTPGYCLHSGEADFIHAAYGNETGHFNAMGKLKHYRYFRWEHFTANHELFPSPVDSCGPDYLLLVYMNGEGIHAVSCAEGERICYSPDRKRLYAGSSLPADYIVKGVPRLGFGNGMDCSWAGALCTALNTMGIAVTYEAVMGVSGACWRAAFSPQWDYSAADGLVAYDFAAPAFKAFGCTPVWANRLKPEERAREKRLVLESIREHRLPVAIHLRVAPEWGVVTGYLDDGAALLCRTYFDEETFTELKDDPEFAADMAQNDGYLYVDQWPYLMVRFAPTAEFPAAKTNLLASLSIRQDYMEKREARGYLLGLHALAAWRDGLLEERWHRDAEESHIARRMSVNHFSMMALTDARRCAAGYLADSLSLLEPGGGREPLANLAGLYRSMHTLLEDCFRQLPGDDALKSLSPRQCWTRELRQKQASVLEQVMELERQAEAPVKEILEGLNETGLLELPRHTG